MRRRIREWSESPYRFIKSKEVRDDDGFITDYTWWYDERDGVHFFMFGDRDIYRPNRDYADWECDSYEEAEEWFWNYDTEELVDDRFDESLKEGDCCDGTLRIQLNKDNKSYKSDIKKLDNLVSAYMKSHQVERGRLAFNDLYVITINSDTPQGLKQVAKNLMWYINRNIDSLTGYKNDAHLNENKSLKEDKDNKLWAILCTDKETGKQYYDDVFDNKEYAHYYAALNRRDYPHYGYGDFTFSVVPMSEDEYNQDVLASKRELHKLILQRAKNHSEQTSGGQENEF